jgi:hypothetical protein
MLYNILLILNVDYLIGLRFSSIYSRWLSQIRHNCLACLISLAMFEEINIKLAVQIRNAVDPLRHYIR